MTDPRNKNIALTGRYGAGKSSILDQFIKDQETLPEQTASRWGTIWQWIRRSNAIPTKVLRISITTLGPDEGEDLTNRIQKELVKQLLYRAKPGELHTSRFARMPQLTGRRSGLDALVVSVVLVGVLWLFGIRPDEDSLGTGNHLLPMTALFLLVFAMLWAVRWSIGNRVVAQVSTGGASISLEEKSDSFFDKYLDELVVFFEATEPDIVVFEDLDRFDDPRIFDSLRELNTLINTSAHWASRQDRPLRFVYAIKDSLFEKLGDEQQNKDAAGQTGYEENSEPNLAGSTSGTNTNPAVDEALGRRKKDKPAEALERANRTKFFEIVIPVVSFLSHSNARDHFLTELELRLPATDINHGLIDIVARHTTDMRLMVNIGNEFVVYAERLLWITEENRAPGISADLLFAVVVYKNFHLTDFEALPHRGSNLDILAENRKKYVDAAIRILHQERSDLISGAMRLRKQEEVVAKLEYRLTTLLNATNTRLTEGTADGVSLDAQTISEPSFWQALARAKKTSMKFRSIDTYGGGWWSIENAQVMAVFPEIQDPVVSSEPQAQADQSRVDEIDAEIEALRGADFKSLVEDARYEYDGKTFDVIVKETMPSELARDLVAKGYIDRFYAEYATVFFGKFLGVDVANFFRNSVWPNEMDVQFRFTTGGAVENVLAQAPGDFLKTRSAMNVDIVNHLMRLNRDSSKDLVDSLARPNNKEGQEFLRTYFGYRHRESAELVSRLAAFPWAGLFNFIAADGAVHGDAFTAALLSASLLSAHSYAAFEIHHSARALIERLHAEIPAFGETQPPERTDILFLFLVHSVHSIPQLCVLAPELRELVVKENHYDLTTENLRCAASLAENDPLSADRLILTPEVWDYCAEHIDDYLALVEADANTDSSCTSSEVLAEVVNTQHGIWSYEQIQGFLDASAMSAALPDLAVIDQVAWATVVERSAAIPNVTNLAAYTTGIGADAALASLFTEDTGEVVDIVGVKYADAEEILPLVPVLLNASDVFTPRQRAHLTKQLLDAPENRKLDLNEILALPDELLAELIRAGLVDDSEEAFAHFSPAGWSSIGPALQLSEKAATFLTPALIQGHAAEVLRGASFPLATRREVLKRVTEFGPLEDDSFLVSAASAARSLEFPLSVAALTLIAPAVQDHEDILWQLREQAESIPVDVVVQILGRMSGGFDGFARPSGHKFEVVDTASLSGVVDRLKLAGVIKLQPGGQPKASWRLRVA